MTLPVLSKRALSFGAPLFLVGLIPLAFLLFRDWSSTGKSAEFTTSNNFNAELIELINTERTKSGLPAFNFDRSLSLVAAKKVSDPNSRTDELLKIIGYPYRSAGESIGTTENAGPKDVLSAFMSDAASRNNILSKDYRDFGMASNSGIVVVVFGVKKGS